MLGRLDISQFMNKYTFAVYNWFGVFILAALAIIMMSKGKRSGKRERMIWGIIHGTTAAIWFVTDCVPWANLIAAQLYTRKANALDPESDKAADLRDRADSCAALAEKQAALLGSIFFVLTAAAMIFIGVRSVVRKKQYEDGTAVLGVINLLMSVIYIFFGVLCICKAISVFSLV
ncbi:MAG: hypothetical protein IJ571_07960 [Ruminococcus sp.]|nr:hypothetical protein [Ruminococcus sp.]